MSNIKFISGLIIGFILLGCVGYMETHHTQQGYVVSVNEDNNNILIEDNTGNLWIINDVDVAIGDEVEITFNNQATITREDDEIVKIKKL